MDLTNDDVADILALLDSLPYDELDLQTPRFRLTLRRTPDGWTQSTQIAASASGGAAQAGGSLSQPPGYNRVDATTIRPDGVAGGAGGAGGDEDDGPGLVAVRAPLPGTFYRAPRPGAEPFVEVGSRVDEDTVIGIVETMKLMNSVPAGTGGRVAEICVGNAEFVTAGATLMRIEADP
jgi:acetyl-CoA carboxylase biotin carboxyl carrier protein